ncbi:MAG TPA: hypothetical protein VEQ11_07865 [Chloroflexota bacterium]|nr:hypothetical protein [Chloroflexota bacterium]
MSVYSAVWVVIDRLSSDTPCRVALAPRSGGLLIGFATLAALVLTSCTGAPAAPPPSPAIRPEIDTLATATPLPAYSRPAVSGGQPEPRAESSPQPGGAALPTVGIPSGSTSGGTPTGGGAAAPPTIVVPPPAAPANLAPPSGTLNAIPTSVPAPPAPDSGARPTQPPAVAPSIPTVAPPPTPPPPPKPTLPSIEFPGVPKGGQSQ